MTFNPEELEKAVFDRSGAILHLDQGIPTLGVLNNPVRTFTTRMMSISDEPEHRIYKLPAYSDLYTRGLIDLAASEDGQEITRETFDILNSVVEAADDIRVSEGAALNLASFAFAGVLMRPKGLLIDRQGLERRWRRSDLTYPDGIDLYGEIFRHRRNAMYDVASQAIVKPKEKPYLQDFNDKGRADLSFGRIAEVIAKRGINPKTIKILNRLCLATYAKTLLPVFEADEEQAEELRDRFIRRGFGVIDELDIGRKIGQEMHRVHVGKSARRHVLRGDASGGGHHIPSLNIAHKSIVSKIVSIPGGYKDDGSSTVNAAVVEVARKGSKVVERIVDTFFPVDWTEHDVIDRIMHPSRVVFQREVNGKVTEFVVSGGVLIKRISMIDEHTGEMELVTAYPAAVVTDEVQRELLLDASGVKLLEEVS